MKQAFICAIVALTFHGAFAACGLSKNTAGEYLVATYDHLKLVGVGDCPLDITSAYRLSADIDASASSTENCDALNVCEGFTPIGNSTTAFLGTFHGAGHSIQNLTINRPDMSSVGLVGEMDASAVIDSIGMLGGTIVGGSYNTGALVGHNDGGTINSSFAAVEVRGEYNVGGLVGDNYGSVNNSYATGFVTGLGSLGGLVGNNSYGKISSCYASGPVLAAFVDGMSAGGLVGSAYDGEVTKSYWNTETSGMLTSVGGTGLTTANMKLQASFSGWNFVSSWSLVAGKSFPLLQGMDSAPFAFTLSQQSEPANAIFTLVSGYSANNNATLVGRLNGEHRLNVTGDSLYFYYRVGAVASGDTVWGGSAFVKVPFDRSKDIAIPDYETLQSLSEKDPYYLYRHYRLTANIDASVSATEPFKPIGSIKQPFEGDFHGAGHSISNLTVNFPDSGYVGLFGAASGSTIDSLILVNVAITGNEHVGGVVANLNVGTISHVSVSGVVTGEHYGSYVGGLVGLNWAGRVEQSVSMATVIGRDYVGGLLGHSDSSTVIGNFASGNVSSWNSAGGLIGTSYKSIITDNYATGNVHVSFETAGGLVGYSSADTIAKCYATGTVDGDENLGGFIGELFLGSVFQSFSTGKVRGEVPSDYHFKNYAVGGLVGYNYSGRVTNSYTTGDVKGDQYVGGLVGLNAKEGSVSSNYVAGKVEGQRFVGGIVGYNLGTVLSNNFWNTDLSDSSIINPESDTSVSALDYTTIQMRMASYFDVFDLKKVWILREDSTYPGLRNVINAPFAFAETWFTPDNFDLTKFLDNDYDIETLQKNLVMQIDTISAGSVDANMHFTFPSTMTLGDTVYITYRLGEVRTAQVDTVWGNRAHSKLILAKNLELGFISPALVIDDIKLQLSGKNLSVQGLRGNLNVYTLKGQRVASLKIQNDGVYVLNIPPGLYVMCKGSRTWNMKVR